MSEENVDLIETIAYLLSAPSVRNLQTQTIQTIGSRMQNSQPTLRSLRSTVSI